MTEKGNMREKIIEVILQSFYYVKDEHPDARLLDPPEKTPLFGQRGFLDSMGLVNLIVDVEERISDNLHVDIVLVDERAMSRKVSPFLSIGSLARYIEHLIVEDKNE